MLIFYESKVYHHPKLLVRAYTCFSKNTNLRTITKKIRLGFQEILRSGTLWRTSHSECHGRKDRRPDEPSAKRQASAVVAQQQIPASLVRRVPLERLTAGLERAHSLPCDNESNADRAGEARSDGRGGREGTLTLRVVGAPALPPLDGALGAAPRLLGGPILIPLSLSASSLSPTAIQLSAVPMQLSAVSGARGQRSAPSMTAQAGVEIGS